MSEFLTDELPQEARDIADQLVTEHEADLSNTRGASDRFYDYAVVYSDMSRDALDTGDTTMSTVYEAVSKALRQRSDN